MRQKHDTYMNILKHIFNLFKTNNTSPRPKEKLNTVCNLLMPHKQYLKVFSFK